MACIAVREWTIQPFANNRSWRAARWGAGARGDLTLGLGARYTGSYYFDAANTAESEAAVIFDAAIGYELFENTDIAMNVSNLFNEQHVVGSGTADYYNPGREISVTLRHVW